MFVDLGDGEWWNVDAIIKVEEARRYPPSPLPTSKIAYVVTLSNGDQRGITEEQFRRIFNISKAS